MPSILSKGIPLHRIPNTALGKVDRRHITRIFFPGLYCQGQNPAIPPEKMATIYEKCLRPAVVSLNPVDRSRWPITYSTAMTLYRDQKGHFHFGTVDFPSHLLNQLGNKLLEMFQMQDGLQDAFFVHELRGTKGASHHDPCDAGARRSALDTVFHFFDLSLVRPEDWVVDIGLEIQHEGHILQWLTKGHRRLLQFLLPSSAEHKIDSILASQTQYHCDLSAQLEDLGGFRALPGSRGKDDKVHYINAYTTDKCATYQLHDGIFKRRQAWHLFPANIGKLVKDLERMAEIFRVCGNSPNVGGHEGNARLEIRVPFGLADKVLLQIPDSVIQDTLVTFDCKIFW
ncbi:hypothetical protein CY34DRAFT_26192 [Suillus luteus UH-Slu-Lm8-n1]|uniref:Uncharacterized protein n=1 Tax=Suillus luteus UH-Slu-Lm8-n1 TaxID=930992 RepID=A0A0C9ZHP2_9AGAM|nr:hypothetical protein CY34DRAFT_26192 [Suillus luteus UH-Slu-Lm8-n1]